jgi:hypothetical protein
VSNGPGEAIYNLIKEIKRIAFGFRNFENYRIRVLFYAGMPNWRMLGSIIVRRANATRQNPKSPHERAWKMQLGVTEGTRTPDLQGHNLAL